MAVWFGCGHVPIAPGLAGTLGAIPLYLLIRMELVADKKTKQPLSRRVTERIFTEAVKRGLLTMAYAASFRIQPALTIDEATAKNGVEILKEVFDVVERERIWQT